MTLQSSKRAESVLTSDDMRTFVPSPPFMNSSHIATNQAECILTFWRMSQHAQFIVGEKVCYIDNYGNQYGPYLVQTPPSVGKCTLCELDGTPALNSALVSLSSLERVK
jgi:hypothetical protein